MKALVKEATHVDGGVLVRQDKKLCGEDML